MRWSIWSIRSSTKRREDKKRIVVDTENYRSRREESLVNLAQRLAEKAKRLGRPVTISPMSAHDRRIIHLALQDDKPCAPGPRVRASTGKSSSAPRKNLHEPGAKATRLPRSPLPWGWGGSASCASAGLQAREILGELFRAKGDQGPLLSHRFYLGEILRPRDQTVLDEVLAVFMEKPKTYTREDVVEIQAHSGILVLQEILEVVLQTGARLAEPGEFTKRAFLNGRIDLTQAEAVIDLIQFQDPALPGTGQSAAPGPAGRGIPAQSGKNS